MPLPIIIAAVAIASASGGGVLSGGVGIKKMRKAKARVAELEGDVAAVDKSTAKQRNACELAFTGFGQTKVNAMADALVPFHDAFGQLKHVDLTVDIRDDVAPSLDAADVMAAGNLSITALDTIGGIAGAGAAGAIASGATTAAVAAFASASTGTAIGSLGGAAATNATLAWLGGGTLASGGGGMALGATMASGIAAAPALLVGGVFLHHKGRSALAKADRYAADAAVAIAKHKECQAVLSATAHQARVAEDLLSRLVRRLMPNNGWLETVVERETDWRKLTDHEREKVRLAATLAMAASDLVHTPVVDEDGALTQAIRAACDHAAVVAR